jgi:uncharacterized protein
MTSTARLVNSNYHAPAWLPDCHSQTIYPAIFLSKPHVHYVRERYELDDGDFIDLDCTTAPASTMARAFVVMFHGLEGSSQSHYALALMHELKKNGLDGAVAHWRGCSGEPNRLARSYHSGESNDIDQVLHTIRKSLPASTELFAVGVSLGGNALLKWLGERPRNASIVSAAVAISAPQDLASGADRLAKGFSRLYAKNFMKTMIAKSVYKANNFAVPYDLTEVRKCKTFHKFDELVTAPLHGFASAKDYWTLCSSKQFLIHIRQPTLVINALNDPFLPRAVLAAPHQASGFVSLEYPQSGGHVGFASGGFPGNHNWLPNRCLKFFGLTP